MSKKNVNVPISSRRRFLKSAVLGSAGVITVPAFAGARVFENASNPSSVNASPIAPASVPKFEFDEITISELQEGMRSGKYTARSITEKYLSRIEAIDKGGPMLNSVIEINPDALEIADRLDKSEEKMRRPLHGIPILIKDNLDTKDKMMTTAGSLALVGSKPIQDSTVAAKLREAGAIILGKTNLSEWANIRSSHSTSGWSGRGGLTRNPFALDRNCSGSSSGSGAAVSANLCVAAIGTETDGSIVSPSGTCGIVGIKPTVGLVSRAGIIPISHTQDGAGPMARTVIDAAKLLGVIVGEDARDAATNGTTGKSHSDYITYVDPNGLKGARIGVSRKYFGFSEAVDAVMNSALEAMQKAGADLIDPADLDSFGKFDDSELTVLMYELKADLNAYLANLGPDAPVKTLKEIIEFNIKNKEKEMPYFGQDLFEKAEAKKALSTDKVYLEALKKDVKLARTQGIEALMDKHRLDAIVAPTGGPAWITDLVNGDHFTGGSSNAAAVAQCPNINVVGGFLHGLTLGISFFGRQWSEPTLIKLAYSFEQATKFRRTPEFLPSIPLDPKG